MKRIACVTIAMGLALAACGKTQDNASATNDGSEATASNDVGMTNDMSGNAMATGNATATTADTNFLTDAMKGDNAEVANGNLAASVGGTSAVKDYGKMLAADHGAHKQKVAALLTSAGGTATEDTPAEAKAMMTKLKGLKGAEFDKAFKTAMIEDHNKDIAKYEKQAAGSDAATAQLAKETLPTLKQHLAAAKAL